MSPKFLLAIPVLLISISVWTLSSLENNLNWSNYNDWLSTRAIRQLIFSIVAVLISFLLVFVFKLHKKIKAIFWFNLIIGVLNLIVIILDLETRGASRWLKFGMFSLQPSEFAKIGIVMWVSYLAAFRDLNKTQEMIWFWSLPVFSFLTIWNPSYGQSDLGTALIVVLPAIVIFLIHPAIKKWYKTILVSVVALTIIFLSFNLAGYQKQRLGIADFILRSESWTPSSSDDINKVCNQTNLYNTCQSVSLIANNQLLGGLESYQTTRTLFLPERQTDFIFASLSHYLGVIGSFTVIFLYAVFFIALARLSATSSPYSFYLIVSGGLILLAQVFANIGMNLGLLPVVGVPLPWLSYGGSHIVSSFLLIFLMIYQDKNKFENHKMA
jgi:rod shape determining protein RodA